MFLCGVSLCKCMFVCLWESVSVCLCACEFVCECMYVCLCFRVVCVFVSVRLCG